MSCLIYIIKNTINDKVYVGQTWQPLAERFSQHKSATTKSRKLGNSINKHGKDKFHIELLDETDNQDFADWLEISYINLFDSIKNGYNIREGGSRGKHSEETKQKMKKPKSEEHKQKQAKIMTGRKHSDAARQKMARSRKGKTPNLGHKFTDEQKARISESLKGKIPWNKGKKYSIVKEYERGRTR